MLHPLYAWGEWACSAAAAADLTKSVWSSFVQHDVRQVLRGSFGLSSKQASIPLQTTCGLSICGMLQYDTDSEQALHLLLRPPVAA